ncbi:MAG: serine hydrolase [Anaerolineaceae bacterium]|nr:serine hydrolase [Anaerolineaceae bacterium]
MKTMKKILKTFAIIIGVIVALYGASVIWALTPSPDFEPYAYEPQAPDYWPTNGFRTSTPEDQGMDSVKLAELQPYVMQKNEKSEEFGLDALSIYRNGYLVADFYFNPLYPRDNPHIIHSVTKSIMSALIGIAIEQGHIESVDTPFVEFFPEKQDSIIDERMKTITLKDLLSMETGMRSRDFSLYQWEGNFAMQKTDDWVAYIMGLPIDAEPGVRFDYSNMSSFLLSAIIEETTDMDTLDFAQENLFNPLGIEDVRWEWSPQGYAIGFARMWLKPEDMAKFGLLYLQQGQWDGEQIVPADWVRESITPHAFPKNYVQVLDENGKVDQQLTSKNWQIANLFRPFSDGYGYQWWLDKDGTYSAVGVGGQYIIVVPKENLVVVVTNASSGMGVFFPRKILDKFILPAIISDETISANEVAYNELLAKSGPPALVNEPQTVSALPEIAMQISGSTYSLEINNLKYDNFQLKFDPTWDYAEFSYTAKEGDMTDFKVGLDGVYHFSETEIGAFAAYGSWTTPNTFEINYQHIGYSTPAKFILTFEGDEITVEEFGVVGSYTYSGIVK